MNRVVSVLVVILLLLSISSMTGLIGVVRAQGGTIIINADGSISPSTAPIYTADNITYTLTGNITITNISDPDGIVVDRDNIVLDGAGYTVTGSGLNGFLLIVGNGIKLDNMSNVTINNMMITNFTTGILLDSSSGNTLSGNNVTANIDTGIYLQQSSDSNTLSGNNITNNHEGIELLYSTSNNAIYDNNFINNTYQVDWYSSTNVWDNGNVGNYWSDYLTRYPNATQVDNSGVWNTPYQIDDNNYDLYPLAVPYAVIPEFPSFLILSLFLITILLAVIIYKKKATPYKRL